MLGRREVAKGWVGAEPVVGGNSDCRWVEDGETDVGARFDRVSCGRWGAGSAERGRVCDLLSGVPEPKAPVAAGEVPPKRDMPGRWAAKELAAQRKRPYDGMEWRVVVRLACGLHSRRDAGWVGRPAHVKTGVCFRLVKRPDHATLVALEPLAASEKRSLDTT
jgi:hypothetical protein